jgi:hypothetical protein
MARRQHINGNEKASGKRGGARSKHLRCALITRGVKTRTGRRSAKAGSTAASAKISENKGGLAEA